MWKSVLKLFLVKKIFVGLMNNAEDPHKKNVRLENVLRKRRLEFVWILLITEN